MYNTETFTVLVRMNDNSIYTIGQTPGVNYNNYIKCKRTEKHN